MTRAARRGVRLALASDRAAIAREADAEPQLVPFDASSPTRREDLATLLRGTAPGSIDVVLAPPLAGIRLLELPATPPSVLRDALESSASAVFAVGSEAQVVQVHDLAASTTRRPVSYASRALVEDILAAAEHAGLTVGSIATWHVVFADAARGTTAERDVSVAVPGDTWSEVLQVAAGQITAIRRGPIADRLRGQLPTLAPDFDATLRLAAQHAGVADRDALWPPAVYEARRAATWRSARRLAGAALLVLAATGIGDGLRIAAQARAIDAERQQLSAAVGRAIALRDSLAAVSAATVQLRSFEADGLDWVDAIRATAEQLPADAALVSVRADADSITVVADAPRGAAVAELLRRAFPGETRTASIVPHVRDGELIGERLTFVVPRSGGRP